MPKTLFLASAASTFALLASQVGNAAPTRGKATRSSKAVVATVDVRGSSARATLRQEDGRRIRVNMKLPRTCNAKRVAEVMANEVLTNPDAFWMHRDATVNLSELPFGIGFDFGAGDSGRGGGSVGSAGGGSRGTGTLGSGKNPFRDDDDDDDRGGTDSDPMDGFEATIADVLATGQHSNGGSRGGGETCFDGTNLDVGALVQLNDQTNLSPAAGGTNKLPNGTYEAKTDHGGGKTTKVIFASDGKTKLSTTTTQIEKTKEQTIMSVPGGSLSGGSSGTSTTSVTTNHANGSTVVTKTWTSSDGSHSSSQSKTTYKNGATSTTTSVTKKNGKDSTTVSQTDNHNSKGKHTGGSTSTEHNGEKTGGTQTPPDKSKDKPAKGDGVKMTSGEHGMVSMPPMCIPDEAIAAIINWNMLQGAITNPAPHTDPEGEPTKSASASPCGGKDSSNFDPDPAYLRPNKQGWVFDPIPGSSRGSDSHGR